MGMAGTTGRPDRAFVARAVAIVLACTLALTFSFFGLVAIVTGESGAFVSRLPFYVLMTAVAFVGTILFLEEHRHDGRAIITMATVAAVVAFLVVALGAEGVAYAVDRPGEVLTSKLFLYLSAAGMIATGLGYWGLHHWREVLGTSAGRL